MGNLSWFKSRESRERIASLIKDREEKRIMTILSAMVYSVESMPSSYFDKAKAK